MSRQQRVEEVAQRYVAGEKYAGIEWQVEMAGEVCLAGQAGFADAQAKTSIPDNALYRIYSMTKPIVSVLALILVEQGKLRLYDMLPQLDPRFAKLRVLTHTGQIQPLSRPVMVEDLLTHRAGFTYEFIHGCHISQYYRAADIIADGQRSLSDMMGALAEQPLAFQPGSAYRYSVCTDVLAHVCECATGESIADLLKQHIFEPLGMQNTGDMLDAQQQERLMPMYGVGDLRALPALDPKPQTLEPMDVDEMYPYDNPKFQRGGHGLYSSLNDYCAFAKMLVDGQGDAAQPLLSGATFRMIQANRIPASQLPLAIGPNVLPGYGWGLVGRVLLDQGQAMGLTGDSEYGWAGAASTYFWSDPSTKMSGVVMTQYLGATMPLADDMRTAAYQALT